MKALVPLLAAGASCGLACVLPGQSLLFERIGVANQGFATDAHWAGDTDLDGHDDYWVSSPLYYAYPRDGKLTLFSGRDGSVLRELFGSQADPISGLVFAVAGDLDGDGTRDLLFGHPSRDYDTGRFQAVSGAHGAVRYAVSGLPRSRLGASFAPLGDLDGDGTADFAVGAPGSSSPAILGKALVCSGRTGTIIREHVGPVPGDSYGFGLAAAGDTNGDGIGDLVVGTASSGLGVGVVHVMSGRDGTTLSTFTQPQPPLGFGYKIAGLGDIDGDGRSDLALSRGATLDIVRGSDGTLIRSHPLWQTSIAGGHDQDYDGVPDYLVGEWDPLNYAATRGRLHVFSGRTGALIVVLTGDQDGDQLGRYVRCGGDLNADGRPDFLTGSSVARQRAGLFRVYGRLAGAYRSFGRGCAGSAGLPALSAPSPPRIGAQFRLLVGNVRPLQPGALLFGASDAAWGSLGLPAALDPLGMTGCTLWVSGEVMQGVSTALGTVSWHGFVPSEPGLVGAVFFNQCLVLDPGSNQLGVVSSDAGRGTIGG